MLKLRRAEPHRPKCSYGWMWFNFRDLRNSRRTKKPIALLSLRESPTVAAFIGELTIRNIRRNVEKERIVSPEREIGVQVRARVDARSVDVTRYLCMFTSVEGQTKETKGF